MTDKWAIDLGTTNTVVAEWRMDTPQTINLPDASVLQQPSRVPLIPSVLYVLDPDKEAVLIGRKALEEDWSGKSPHCFRSFKRQLARKLGVVTRLGGQEFTPERVAWLFFQELFNQLQSRYGKGVEEITCTVPVEFFEPYREAINRIVTRLGVKHMRTVDEPVAAALGYGLNVQNEGLVMVIDFGGGTLDMALMRLGRGREWEEGRATVLAKTGESLGGDDVDSWIMEEVGARYKKRLEHFAHLHRLFKTMAEKVKIDLSSRESSQFTVFDDRTGKNLDQVFTRADLETILRQNGLFQHLHSQIARTLALARRKGVTKEDIDHVLLIGGSCLIPSIQALIRDYFDPGKIKEHLPFEAVAHGACVFARGLAKPIDFIQHDYGLRILNTETFRHEYEVLVPKGTIYPTRQDFVSLTLAASRPNQEEIELLIYEIGGEESFSGEYVWIGGQLRKIGRGGGNVACLNEGCPTLARLNPPGHPNRDRLQVTFKVDADRHLCVTLHDLLRGVDLLLDQPVVQLK